MTAKEAYEYLKDKKITDDGGKIFHIDKVSIGVFRYAILNEDNSIHYYIEDNQEVH